MYKCLIVDDEQNIRERLTHNFPWEEFDFEVIGTAKDGLSALDMIEEEVPNLVLTDVRMPNMDGLKLAENLYRYFPNVLVVIVSSYDDFELAQQAINYNVKGYLLKPLMKKEFREMMSKITQLLQSSNLTPNKETHEKVVSPSDYISFAKKYVQEHYAENITIKDISEKLYIHEAYFSKLFNEETGVGFSLYINKVRVVKAKALIRYTTYQLKDISSMVGFSSHSYFNKVFKDQVGVSPLTFRKQEASYEK